MSSRTASDGGSLQSSEDDVCSDFQLQIQDQEHFYAPWVSKTLKYRFQLPSPLVSEHALAQGYIAPLQPYAALCDDPTSALFYVNIAQRRSENNQLPELPYPSLLIRPICANLVQGLTPAGRFVEARSKEQAQFYAQYEEDFGAACACYALLLHRELGLCASVLQCIGLQRRDVAFTLAGVGLSAARIPRRYASGAEIQRFLASAGDLSQFEQEDECRGGHFRPAMGERIMDGDECAGLGGRTAHQATAFAQYAHHAPGAISVAGYHIPQGVARSATTYQAVERLLQLLDANYSDLQYQKAEKPIKNIEKYQNAGFEDEKGECKVCGVKYGSYFEHIASQEHHDAYVGSFNTVLRKKASNFTVSKNETCFEYVNRHMKHLEKRSELAAQTHVVACQIAYRYQIRYETACRLLTYALFEKGVNFVISEVESIVPQEFYNYEFSEYVLQQHEERIQQAILQEPDYISIANQMILLQQAPKQRFDVLDAITAQYCTLDLEFFSKYDYNEKECQCFVNFVDYVESLGAQVVRSQTETISVEQLIFGLQELEIDKVENSVLALVASLKLVLQASGFFFYSDNGGFKQHRRMTYRDIPGAESFNERCYDDVYAIPRLRAVYATQFEQEVDEVIDIFNNFDAFDELERMQPPAANEPNEITRSSSFMEASDDSEELQTMPRANSFSSFPIELQNDQISYLMLERTMNTDEGYNPALELQKALPEVILRNCMADCLISLQSSFGLDLQSAVIVELRAIQLLGEIQQGIADGTGCFIIPYERCYLSLNCNIK